MSGCCRSACSSSSWADSSAARPSPGAEWRAGTITTVLTWEPRRLRLHSARLGSGAILAFVISFALQVVFLASFVPAVLVNGTSDGVDGSFWLSLAVVMARTSVITAAAAVLAMSLATAARNTAFAVIAMFAWIVVIEGLIRALKPSLSSWLWGETVTTVTAWSRTRHRRRRPRPPAVGSDPCGVPRRDRRRRSDLVRASRHRRRHVSDSYLPPYNPIEGKMVGCHHFVSDRRNRAMKPTS